MERRSVLLFLYTRLALAPFVIRLRSLSWESLDAQAWSRRRRGTQGQERSWSGGSRIEGDGPVGWERILVLHVSIEENSHSQLEDPYIERARGEGGRWFQIDSFNSYREKNVSHKIITLWYCELPWPAESSARPYGSAEKQLNLSEILPS